MKNATLFLTGLLILGSHSFGQKQFTADNSYRVNSGSKLGFAIYLQSFESLVPQTGSNYTWDFRQANWTDPVTPYLFQPSTASIHNLFYHTEINEYGNVLFGRDLFYTYSAGRDTLYCDGFYAAANYLYRPRIPYLTFPLNFGDSVYSRTRQYAVPTQPTTATGSISRYWVYDGYGTLQLPYGTVTDVYRIRTRQTDSSYVLNSATVYDETIWFRQDGIPVLRLQKNATIMNAYFASAGSSGIDELSVNTGEISIYPNPAGNKITILASDQIAGTRYRVSDHLGRTVMMGMIHGSSEEIDVSSLSPGLYYLLTDIKSANRLRFIKL